MDAYDAALRRIEMLQQERAELISAIFAYRSALEHYLNMAVAAGADTSVAYEALKKIPRVSAPLRLVRSI